MGANSLEKTTNPLFMSQTVQASTYDKMEAASVKPGWDLIIKSLWSNRNLCRGIVADSMVGIWIVRGENSTSLNDIVSSLIGNDTAERESLIKGHLRSTGRAVL